MQIILNPILVRNLGLSTGSVNKKNPRKTNNANKWKPGKKPSQQPKPADGKLADSVVDATQWVAPSTGKAPTNEAEAIEAGGLTPQEAQSELGTLGAQVKVEEFEEAKEEQLQEKLQYGSWSQADIDWLIKNGGETWWRELPSTGDEAMDRLQAKFIAGMDEYYDEDQTRKATAAGWESKYKKTLTATNKQIQQITDDNLSAIEKREAAWKKLTDDQTDTNDEALALGQDAIDAATQAGLDARNAFAESSRKAQAAYDAEAARAMRLETAYVPDDQPTATSPVIGDDRRRLLNGSGVDALKIRAPRATGNEVSGLAGLQFA